MSYFGYPSFGYPTAPQAAAPGQTPTAAYAYSYAAPAQAYAAYVAAPAAPKAEINLPTQDAYRAYYAQVAAAAPASIAAAPPPQAAVAPVRAANAGYFDAVPAKQPPPPPRPVVASQPKNLISVPRTQATSAAIPTTSFTQSYTSQTPVTSAAQNYVRAMQPSSQRPITYGAPAAAAANFQPPGAAAAAFNAQKRKFVPKATQQLFFCEICRISCVGPHTYKEHMNGTKHKKKVAANESELKAPAKAGAPQLRCEVCDVCCTGADAYNAHIRGAKHQKVIKLHQRLGKPIPATPPIVIEGAVNQTETTGGSATSKPFAATKVNFVATGTLSNVAPANGEPAKAVSAAPVPAVTVTAGSATVNAIQKIAQIDEAAAAKLLKSSSIAPIGHEYIEEIRDPMSGKVLQFSCKLCDCKFNDPNAKDMHLKGHRHRMAYKRKVDPSFKVDAKTTMSQRKKSELLQRKVEKARDDYWRQRDTRQHVIDEMRKFEESMLWVELPPDSARRYMPSLMCPRHTLDDHYMLVKHKLIYPTDFELTNVQRLVAICEKSLKLASDEFFKEQSSEQSDSNVERLLKGVMRTGRLAKGLLLRGCTELTMVLLLTQKPTVDLLVKICALFQKNVPEVVDAETDKDQITVSCEPKQARFVVTLLGKPDAPVTSKLQCFISVSSPHMRPLSVATEGESQQPDPENMLDKEKCLQALAELRHAKWFQARCAMDESILVVLRILNELQTRVATWKALHPWAMELLVEKCCHTVQLPAPLTAGALLRRVFECVSSGILMPDHPGLLDPCEKDPTNVLSSLTLQQCEDLTASAQHALRLMAFRMVHKVLGMEQLPLAAGAKPDAAADDEEAPEEPQLDADADADPDADADADADEEPDPKKPKVV